MSGYADGQRDMQEAAAKVARADNAAKRTAAEKRICHRIALTIRELPLAGQATGVMVRLSDVLRVVREEGPQNPEHDCTDHARTRAAMRDAILNRLAVEYQK